MVGIALNVPPVYLQMQNDCFVVWLRHSMCYSGVGHLVNLDFLPDLSIYIWVQLVIYMERKGWQSGSPGAPVWIDPS